MQINIIALGKKMPGWIEAGFTEYTKRMPTEMSLNLIELSTEKRGKNANISKILIKEGKNMLDAILPNQHVIALDTKGAIWSTEILANNMKTWRQEGRDISLLIGGPDGLAPECLNKAEQSWSLSNLTFPHQIVRVILAEQLYRAWSMLNHHPYHK